MSKKALLVGLEYPSEPHKLGSSVNSILEFNRCLIDHLHFLPTNIEILVDTPATDQGDKQFDVNEVAWKLLRLVHDAKEGDLLLFAFSGHGTYGGPSGHGLYLGIDPEDGPVFLNASIFERVLDQLKHKMPADPVENFGFIDQLRNHDVSPPIVQYPSVIVFMSSITGAKSKSTFSYKWDCSCSNFIYAAIQAIQKDKNATNLELAQCIDLIIEEIDRLQAENRISKARQLDGEKKKVALEKAMKLNKYVQHATLSCTDAQSRAQCLSD